MAKMDVGPDPTQVPSLTVGSTYFFQNQGSEPIILIEAAATPARSEDDGALLEGRTVGRTDSVSFELGSGNNVYARTEKGLSGGKLWWNEVL